MPLSDLTGQAADFVRSHNKMVLAVSALLLFFAISAFVIAMAQSAKGTKKPVQAPYDGTFTAIDDFLAPQAPAIVEDYYYSRQKDGQWDEADEERWFTEIDQRMLDGLSEANASIAESITEAAP